MDCAFQHGFDVPAGPGGPAYARAQVGKLVQCLLVTDVVLAVSELVTNALAHGAPPVKVTLECAAGQLRLAVHDHHDDMPLEVQRPHPAHGGHGLLIVGRLANQWGSQPETPGKIVWANFTCPT